MGNKSIEAEFMDSWDSVLLHYHTQILLGSRRWLIPMDSLIHQLRFRGFDRQLRAGLRMYEFVISRSREWGLKEGQAHIGFELLPTGLFTLRQYNLDNSEPIFLQDSKITDEVESLLKKLLSHPID